MPYTIPIQRLGKHRLNDEERVEATLPALKAGVPFLEFIDAWAEAFKPYEYTGNWSFYWGCHDLMATWAILEACRRTGPSGRGRRLQEEAAAIVVELNALAWSRYSTIQPECRHRDRPYLGCTGPQEERDRGARSLISYERCIRIRRYWREQDDDAHAFLEAHRIPLSADCRSYAGQPERDMTERWSAYMMRPL